jgi:hypothetical protein
MKTQKIQQRLKKIEEHLRSAEEYIARNVNVRSRSFLHSKDWEGKSGHPLWMRNFMIPTVKKALARKEKALERVIAKEKQKNIHQRRRNDRVNQQLEASGEVPT